MNMRRHDLNLLVILEAILREGSISISAERLGMTQPAASQALARAREMFSDPLMLRSGRGLVPTARGLALRGELSAILDRITQVINAPTFNPSTARRTFKLATGDVGELVVLASVLPTLAAEAPLCRFEILPVKFDYGTDLPDILLMGADSSDDNWLAEDLYNDRFVVLARKDHPALGRPLDAESFARLPHVLVSPRGGGFTGPVDDALALIGLSRQVVVSLSRFTTLPNLLSLTDFVAAVPKRFAGLACVQALCASRELPLAIPQFTMKLMWHRTRNNDPDLIWVRKRIQELHLVVPQ